MRGWRPAAARRMALFAAVALTLAWTLLAFASPPAHAAGSGGTVTGVLTNGTTSATVAGQRVTLQLTIGGTAKDLASVTTDAAGAFTVTGVDASPADLGANWAVYTTFQGGLYSSAPVTVKPSQSVDASFAVYNATQDTSHLRVRMATILIREPDAKHGLVGIGEFFTIENTGKTAFVGEAPSVLGAPTAMPSLLRFALPANAINLTTGAGFFNTQVIQISAGFAATATVPPGQTEFAFAFQIPYIGSSLSVPFKAEYPTDQVVALVLPTMLVRDTSGLSADGIVTAFGARYQVFSASGVAPQRQLSLNLYDLPQAGERQDLNTHALMWLAAALALLLTLLLALYLWRGALGSALGLTPAATCAITSNPDVTAGERQREAERKRLLETLLDLERRRARGELSAERFKQEEAAPRRRLRELLAGEDAAYTRASEPVATATPSGAADIEAAEPAPGSRGGAR